VKTLVLFAVGIAFAILTALLYVLDPDRVAVAICAAWWLGLTIAIGALALVMTLDASHATWFVVFRPIATRVAVALPLLALGLVPAALVAHRVYPWAGFDEGIALDALTRMAPARAWMSPWPVYFRTIISLGVWSTLAIVLHSRTSRVASGAGIPLVAITATVTPFDWMMQIEPGWGSTIYAMYVVISGLYGATGLLAVAVFFADPRDARADHFHALGRIMLAAVCLWGYLGFFQLMLQWIGNLPAEVPFYVRRAERGWVGLSWLLVVGHFVVPFFLLLSRPLKRSARALAYVGALMVVMHVADIAWLVLPARAGSLFASALAPLLAVAGLAGAWSLWRPPSRTRDPEYLRGARYESP
jgi:hypothetical protein